MSKFCSVPPYRRLNKVMNSTTIDATKQSHEFDVDLLSPSAEDSGSELNANTPHLISVRYTDIPTYLHRSEFYLSLDCDQSNEFISIPANCLWPGGAINNTEEFRQYLHTLHFWGMRHFTLEGLEFVFPTVEGRYDTNDAREFSARHWDTMTDVCGADSTLHGALRGVMDEIHISNDPWYIVQPYNLILLLNEGATARKACLVRILCRHFAREGCLDELVAMHQQYGDGIWNEWTSERAAQSGNIECVQYLVDNGCEYDANAAGAAALGGHLHILQYLHNNKLGFDENTNKWPPKVAEHAVGGGHVSCLTFIHENGHPWDEKAYEVAGENGDMKALEYLHEHRCPWDKETLLQIIQFKHLNAVKFMVERGCPLPAGACVVAAGRGGDLATLQYLHECGCAWYENESDMVRNWAAGEAAHYGQIDTLRYAVEHGCPLEDGLLHKMFYREFDLLADETRDTDILLCLQYLVEEQFQVMDDTLFLNAFCSGYFQCIRYLIDMGCPYKPAPPYRFWRYEIKNTIDPDQFYECLKYAIERGWPFDVALLGAINYSNDEKGSKFARTVEYLQQEGLWSDVDSYSDHRFPL